MCHVILDFHKSNGNQHFTIHFPSSFYRGVRYYPWVMKVKEYEGFGQY